MKSFLFALALITGISAHASTIDGYTLPITGIQTEENFIMNAIQTRTEYRTETVARTCYRTVPDGYRMVCRLEPVVQCYEDSQSRRICNTRYENRCYREIQYRQEAYTCYQQVTSPYEVFSHNVKANVKVKVSNIPGDLQAPHNTCGIDFTLDGQSFKSKANCAEFIVLAKNEASEERVGNTLIQNRVLDLTLLDANKISAPTKNGIKDMRLEGQTLVLTTGDLTKNPNFSLKLFVERKKLFGDERLINRNLAPSEYSFEKINENSGIVKINLSKLIGGINDKKKHVLKVDLNVATDISQSINSTLPTLSASESITVNN